MFLFSRPLEVLFHPVSRKKGDVAILHKLAVASLGGRVSIAIGSHRYERASASTDAISNMCDAETAHRMPLAVVEIYQTSNS